MRRLLFLLALLLCGCGVNPGKNPDRIEIAGTVTLAGKEVHGVILNLQVTGTGTPASLPVTKGTVKGTVTPGKYTYYLSAASSPADFKAVPEIFRAGSLERQIVIKGTGPVEIAFEFDK